MKFIFENSISNISRFLLECDLLQCQNKKSDQVLNSVCSQIFTTSPIKYGDLKYDN